MKTFFIFTLFFTLTAAHGQDPDLEKDCAAKNGLACAKLAYQYRLKGEAGLAYQFYQKGCELKEASSCHNMANLNPRELYFSKLDAVMRLNSQKILNCYKPAPTYKTSRTQLKEKWYPVDFVMNIHHDGTAELVNLKTELPISFSECAKKVVKTLKFPAPQGPQTPIYQYRLNIETAE